ncbi:MAG: sigma factor-like helix-turn-helix DNA-binding protein [Candidatus Pelethousia sp.]|nr:sigma factor-like helix-turn-helix DNA-binding protein [Candidatus Pelethousia sp.]
MQYDMENYMVSAQALERYYGPQPEQPAQAAYKATEQRLYRVPVLREKVEDDKEDLMALESGEAELLCPRPALLELGRTNNLRRSPQEIRGDQMAVLRSRLAASERELRRMAAALSCIAEDPYYPAIELRYFQGMREVDIAERLQCDPATVRRNRARLVKRLALRLYGVDCQ